MPKTPLRYPGGKSRAVEKIMPYIRNLDCGELCSPFLGGGSIELKCAEEGMTVHGYDLFQPLVWFWQELLADPAKLVKAIEDQRKPVIHYTEKSRLAAEWAKKCSGKCLLAGTSKEYCNYHKKLQAIKKGDMRGIDERLFKAFRHSANFTRYCDDTTRVSHKEILQQAVGYYIVNRCSFSGSTTSGGWSWKASWARLTQNTLDNLSKFKVDNFVVRNADFKVSIAEHPDAGLYLDPPYCLNKEANDGVNRETLYGSDGDHHKGFDHAGLANILKSREKWVLSYNDCEYIRELYDGYTIKKVDWKYGMKNQKDRINKETGKNEMGSSSEILIIG